MSTRSGIFILTLLAGFTFILAKPNISSAESTTKKEFYLDAGYRSDKLEWSIAGGGVNILSELTWDDLDIYQIRGGGEFSLDRGGSSSPPLHFKGEIAYGWILDGENQDSDYAGDNRTLEWSRSINDAGEGNVLDISGGAGLRFSFNEAKIFLTPMVGWSYHEQNLTMTDGYQAISDQAIADAFFGPGVISLPDVGPIQGLDSTYDARWYGPWIGFEFKFNPPSPLSFLLSAEYHWGWYEGEGVWNLRNDLAQDPSFKHEADSRGTIVKGGGRYALSETWNLRLNIEFKDWETDPGTDRTYYASGASSLTRLNEAEWRSASAMLGVEHLF